MTPFKPPSAFKINSSGIRSSPWRNIESRVAQNALPTDCIQFIFMNRIPMTGPESMYAISILTPYMMTSSSWINKPER